MRTVAVGVVFARDIVTFVSVFFASSEKEAHECLDVLVIVKIWFQRLDRLSMSIHAQGVMFKVEWILNIVSVESVIVHAADYEPRQELTGKQFLVITVQVACRDSIGLAYDSLDWVLG